MEYVDRHIEAYIEENLSVFPAVIILGSRQCGKSTLIKKMAEQRDDMLYLDLQNRNDLAKLNEPSLFFQHNERKTICLDEIQRSPDIFPVLRSEIDRNRRPGRFILLGSASRNLIQHSSESLAGRVGLVDLTPFLANEIDEKQNYDYTKYWFRGGYPDSYNADSDSASSLWRENFIRTYIERDIPQLGFQIAAPQLMRLLTMTAHEHGQLLNASKLASSMDLTAPTIRHYLDIMEQTYIIRSLPPYYVNTKKRLVKAPKIYIRDSGILHQILQIPSFNELLGNTIIGNSWEGLVVENVCSLARHAQCFFYRSATGDEMDLLLQYPNNLIAIECKSSSAPSVTEGFWKSIEFLNPSHTYIVAPVESSYPMAANVYVCNLSEMLRIIVSFEKK
ncbi:MAG: ATP-binding protein [Bacteroidales bacterium]|nr:ATP-binding protein [Bacteroidales bacterium]MBQ4216219.1 ATP-binding protein [Bacteroidales bacterium]